MGLYLVLDIDTKIGFVLDDGDDNNDDVEVCDRDDDRGWLGFLRRTVRVCVSTSVLSVNSNTSVSLSPSLSLWLSNALVRP